MSKTITIPHCRNPFHIIVNGVVQSFRAGETVEVDDSVADVIQNHIDLLPKEDPNAGKESGGGASENLLKCIEGTATEITAEDLQGVTVFGKGAFQYCASLVEITIPKNVTKLEMYSLGSCTKLKRVILESSTPPSIQTTTFTSTSKVEYFVVPVGAGDAYRNATNWSKYASKIIEGSAPEMLFESENITDEPRTDLPAPVNGVSYTAFITNDAYSGEITATCEDGHIEFADYNEDLGTCNMLLRYDDNGAWCIVDGETLTATVSIRING
jgi:hypothetical protein